MPREDYPEARVPGRTPRVVDNFGCAQRGASPTQRNTRRIDFSDLWESTNFRPIRGYRREDTQARTQSSETVEPQRNIHIPYSEQR